MTPATGHVQDHTNLLPKVLQEFVRHIGFAATMKVVERCGGTRLYVPATPTPEHWLATLIGFDKMAALCKVYGLEDHFDIPKCQALMLHLRNERIRSEYGPKSAATLAREHELTERQIFYIVGTPAPDKRQGSLVF